MTDIIRGAWACSYCGNLERVEREEACWICGRGEMLFIKNIFELDMFKPPNLKRIGNVNSAHYINLLIRRNGQDEWYEADWLKHILNEIDRHI